MCEIKIPSSLQNCLQQELGAALNVPGVKQVLLSIRVLRPPKWQGWESPLESGSAGYKQLFGTEFFLI